MGERKGGEREKGRRKGREERGGKGEKEGERKKGGKKEKEGGGRRKRRREEGRDKFYISLWLPTCKLYFAPKPYLPFSANPSPSHILPPHHIPARW